MFGLKLDISLTNMSDIHFNEEMSRIKDLTPLEALHILVFGLKIEPFTISLVRLPSEEINELRKRVRYYIIMEEITVAK
jgi:hypothetical protein